MQAEEAFRQTSLGPTVPATYRRLPGLQPKQLAIMHGSSYRGDGAALLRAMAECTSSGSAADRSRELSWSTVRGDKEIVRWTYRLELASAGGTDVIESFQAIRWPLDVRIFEDVVMRNRDHVREAAMRTTLQRIKAAAEARAALPV